MCRVNKLPQTFSFIFEDGLKWERDMTREELLVVIRYLLDQQDAARARHEQSMRIAMAYYPRDGEIHEHAHGGIAFAIGAVLFAPVWAVAWVLTLPARLWRKL